MLLKKTEALLLDLDLTHRQVSNTSTTYPDAQFGWQDDKVGLGYDAALLTLTSLTYGRLFAVRLSSSTQYNVAATIAEDGLRC